MNFVQGRGNNRKFLEIVFVKIEHYLECFPFWLMIIIGFTPDKTRVFTIIQIFCRKVNFLFDLSILSRAKSKLAMRSGPNTVLKMDKTTTEVSLVGKKMMEVGPPMTTSIEVPR